MRLTISDGKLVRFRFYQTKQDALNDLASEGAPQVGGGSRSRSMGRDGSTPHA